MPGASDKAGQSSAFIEFMLSALLTALNEAAATGQVSDQVKALLKCLANGPLAALACMKKPGLSHRPTFRKNYLQPALDGHLIERTLPDKPHGVPPWTQFQAGVSPPGKLKPRRARCGRAQRRG